MAAKKERKKPLGRGVGALIQTIDEKVKERKQIPFAPPGFAEDQETLALSRHELLVERNKLKERAGKAEAAIRGLHRKIDELQKQLQVKSFEYVGPTPEQMAQETIIRAGSSPKTVTIEREKKWDADFDGGKGREIPPQMPLVTPDGKANPVLMHTAHGARPATEEECKSFAPIPKSSEDEVTKVIHTKERIEIPVVKTVEVPGRFDWTLEFALMFLLIGGVLIGIALANINLTRGAYVSMLQMQTTQGDYPEERPRDYVAPSVLSSQARSTDVQGGAK